MPSTGLGVLGAEAERRRRAESPHQSMVPALWRGISRVLNRLEPKALDIDTALLALSFLVIALIYGAVGQAGASGYIAAKGLAGFAPLAMKTTALSLNLLVAAIG